MKHNPRMMRRASLSLLLPLILLVVSVKYGYSLAIISDHRPSSFWIERVASSTAEQCLDVLVFRGMSIRNRSNRHNGNDCEITTNEEAALLKQQLRAKMPRTTASFEAGGGAIVQFVAMSSSSSSTDNDDDAIIVGAIDAVLEPSVRARTFELPARVHVTNLRVHEKYRRQGIARALLLAVVEQYAALLLKDGNDDDTTIIPKAVTLKVERQSNPTAVQLYEQEGFVFQEQVYAGFMIKTLDSNSNSFPKQQQPT